MAANATIASGGANVATADTVSVRIRAELQRQAKIAAAVAGVTLEAWLNAAIQEKLSRAVQ